MTLSKLILDASEKAASSIIATKAEASGLQLEISENRLLGSQESEPRGLQRDQSTVEGSLVKARMHRRRHGAVLRSTCSRGWVAAGAALAFGALLCGSQVHLVMRS